MTSAVCLSSRSADGAGLLLWKQGYCARTAGVEAVAPWKSERTGKVVAGDCPGQKASKCPESLGCTSRPDGPRRRLARRQGSTCFRGHSHYPSDVERRQTVLARAARLVNRYPGLGPQALAAVIARVLPGAFAQPGAGIVDLLAPHEGEVSGEQHVVREVRSVLHGTDSVPREGAFDRGDVLQEPSSNPPLGVCRCLVPASVARSGIW